MASSDTEIFEHYEVLRRENGSLWELGRGAMGVTYKAIDNNLHKVVALKVINVMLLEATSARERFVREARAAASLNHRNVAAVYHLGLNAQNFFYAMEFIDGETVDAVIKRGGPQPWPVALSIVLQAARALMAAHEKHLVHRDIKPANIMLVQEAGEDALVVKLIDFGLAKSVLDEGGGSHGVGGTTGFLGTPLYASPEQCDELTPDTRSDIYSLGVTLWFMLAGRPPFIGSMGKVFAQHLHSPPPWERLPDELPEPVRALLTRMLSKDREERPQTPADLRREIDACLRGAEMTLPPSILPRPAAPSAPTPADPVALATETLAEASVTVSVPRVAVSAAPSTDAPPTGPIPPSGGSSHGGPLRRDAPSLPIPLPAADGSATPPVQTAPSAPPPRQPRSPLGKLFANVRTMLLGEETPPPPGEPPPPVRPAQPPPLPAAVAPRPRVSPSRPEEVQPLLVAAREAMMAARWQEAAEGYTRVLALDPDSLEALDERGTAHDFQAEADRARADYAQAVALAPLDALDHFFRADAWRSLQEPEKAAADFRQAATHVPRDAREYCLRGIAREALQQHPLAIQDYDEAVRLDPRCARAFSNRAYAYYFLQKHDRAVQDYDEAIRLNPQDARAFNNRGNAYYFLHRYDRAIEDYNEAVRLQPRYARAFNNRGDAYYFLQKYDRAIEDYDAAIRLQPQFAAAYSNRAAAKRKLGHIAEAQADDDRSTSFRKQL